jgi:NAD(P)-dependent dehydrogenase (short-subunit alcohol dehydrogenase family)
MKTALAKLHRKWKRLDVIFANAGINGVWAPLAALKIHEWDETIRINLRGTFLTIKLALPYFPPGGGSIIVTSSVNGTRMFSNVGASAYATTKAAQVAFAKMLAVEFGRQKIRVNAICPGSIETEIDENTQPCSRGAGTEGRVSEGEIPLTGRLEPPSRSSLSSRPLTLAISPA